MNQKLSSKALAPMGGSTTDPAKALLKGVLSGVPIIGGVISEIVGQIIPDQRMDRLEEFVRHLAIEFEELGAQADVGKKMKSSENVDLFEDGAVAAARALSEERRRRIAHLVAAGISGDDQSRMEAKRLLALLNQLDDDQIVILASYLRKNAQNLDFRRKHEATLSAGRGHNRKSRADVDAALVRSLGREGLIRLGLIEETFKKPARSEMAELDEKTGRMKAQGRRLSQLGRLLLRRIGLSEDGDA